MYLYNSDEREQTGASCDNNGHARASASKLWASCDKLRHALHLYHCVFKQIIGGDGLGLQRRVSSLKNKTFWWGLDFFFVFISRERVTEVRRCHVTFFLGLFCNKILKKIQPTPSNKKTSFAFLFLERSHNGSL